MIYFEENNKDIDDALISMFLLLYLQFVFVEIHLKNKQNKIYLQILLTQKFKGHEISAAYV